jgi:acetyltransferase-like isoleucine patch superfamily enzyme
MGHIAKSLKKLYHILIWPVYLWRNFCKFYFNFIIPNLKPILLKRIKLCGERPVCNQKTVVTGLGVVEIGNKCILGFKSGGFHRGGCIEFQPRTDNSKIIIGNNIAANNNIFICAANFIEIGDNSLIGQNVTIMDFEAHGISPEKRNAIGTIGKVIIGKNVWIGNNVTILKNSEIGDNSIVATGAVVNGKFPSNVIIGGLPARIIKEL